MTQPNEGELPQHLVDLIERGRRAKLIDDVRSVVAQELRETLPEAIREVVRGEVEDALEGYFGSRPPEQVREIIVSAERWHRRIGSLADGLWQSTLTKIFQWGLWLFLLGYFFFGQTILKAPANPIAQ